MLRVIFNVVTWVAEHVTGLCWLVAALLAIWVAFFYKFEPTQPLPCASYSDTNREHVPARCFSDFLGKDGGTHE